ncbi:MAG: NrfD/PsrC family molybdoenzyme membrane anchor subunit [Candidatus Baltobacteraceae bacterium]
MNGYYNRPVIKPPEWTDLIPVYFCAGGMAGTSATLAAIERLRGNHGLARTLIAGAAGASALSGFCLIADLKKPSRFLNMFRVFKISSPMSVGVYLFSAFGGAATIAAASEITGIARPAGRAFEYIAGLLGPFMSVYTAVLISDTAVPAWYHGRRSLPLVFAATSASTAAALGMLAAPAGSAEPARRLAVIGGAAVPFALQRLHAELGPLQTQAYKRREARSLAALAKALNAAGAVCALFARNRTGVQRTAGALLLAGGLAERFAVMRAGSISANDPAFTIQGQ